MKIRDIFRSSEARGSVEDPRVPVSSSDFMRVMGWGELVSSSGVTVGIDNALGVPAVWAAVNFLSGTIAGLTINVYKKTNTGRQKVKSTANNAIPVILQDAINPTMSSFEWRKYTFDQVFTGGRGITYIERNNSGQVVNLYALDPSLIMVRMSNGRKIYDVRVSASSNQTRSYDATEIIDIPFMVEHDFVTHRGPIMTNRDAIGMAIAASRYGSKAFQSGGVPPAVIQGNFQSGAAASRASDDIANAMARLARDGRSVMALPSGHELKTIGFNPEQMQLLELQRFSIEQIARIYSLPPVFLQDLTHGTFSNVEQQDLHFVKHTVKRWIEQTEQEMNLKLFGRGSPFYIEFELDDLLRGDLKTRMEAHATSIQNGIKTPNEVRDIENLPPMEAGDDLMIQGATVPIKNQSMPVAGNTQPQANGDQNV
jgi:HK97 family phage portal protein